MSSTKTGRLWLPYFKQGDDMHASLAIGTNGKLDVKTTLDNHISLLKGSIDILEKIRDSIPENKEFSIHADTHYIAITGDQYIIERLQNNNLLEQSDELSEESAEEIDREDGVDNSSEENLLDNDNESCELQQDKSEKSL